MQLARPFRSGAVALIATSLSSCGGPPIPASLGGACLMTSVGGNEAPILGFPVHMLDDVWRKAGGTARMDGPSVIVLTRPDPLTKRDKVLRLQVESGKSDLRTSQCGPASAVVVGMTVDGQPASEESTSDTLLEIARSAMMKFGLKMPEAIPDGSEPKTTTMVETTEGQMAPTPPVPAATPEPQTTAASTPPPLNTMALTDDYGRCMSSEDARSQLPVALKECTNDELGRQDRKLNDGYRATLARLNPARQQALREEERAWLAQNTAVCRREAGADGDIMDDLAYSDCVLRRTVEREPQIAAYR